MWWILMTKMGLSERPLSVLSKTLELNVMNVCYPAKADIDKIEIHRRRPPEVMPARPGFILSSRRLCSCWLRNLICHCSISRNTEHASLLILAGQPSSCSWLLTTIVLQSQADRFSSSE